MPFMQRQMNLPLHESWQDRNPEVAKDYLNILEETLNARIGVAHAKSMRDSDRGTALGAVNTGLYGFGAGVDQFAGGIGQAFFVGAAPHIRCAVRLGLRPKRSCGLRSQVSRLKPRANRV